MKSRRLQLNQQQGFALLLSIIIASVVLAIGVSILKISVSQIQLSATGRESEISFHASQSITECLTYHRYTQLETYASRPGTFAPGTQINAPNITCMGEQAVDRFAEVIANTSDRHIVRFHYTFSWGTSPELCSAGDMYIMVPYDTQITHTFTGTSVGEDGDGLKRCNGGSICTIIITQGYNRPCDQLQSSIFTLQRELTTEF